MKLLWWKVYFWLNVVLLSFAAIAEFYTPTAPAGVFVFDMFVYGIALLGVFAFISRKPLFTTVFWKYFFWFNVVYTALYVLYAFAPDAPLISSLAFLAYGQEETALVTAMISVLLSIPYLYAAKQLSLGNFLELKTKEQEKKEIGTLRWGFVQTALWGYSLVFVSLLILFTFLPSPATSGGGSSDIVSGALIFAPILLFWLWVVWEYKRYHWNWWRITLVLNSVLFSSIIVLGTFFYEPVASSGSEEFDIIGMLQFLIIFAGLIVFGREQFPKAAPAILVEKPKEKKEHGA